jgi:hypothetical protein
MPRTVSVTRWPDADSTSRRCPTIRWWALANFFVRTVPSCSSVASVAEEPRSHSSVYIFLNDSGSIAVKGLFSSITGAPGWERSCTLPLVMAIAVTVCTPCIERSAGAT